MVFPFRLILFIGFLLFSLLPEGRAQNYFYQAGLTVAGGFATTTHLNSGGTQISEAGTNQKAGFSYEISYLNSKALSEYASFSFGISALALRNSFSTGNTVYERKDGSGESVSFLRTDQRLDRYFIGFPFRWNFYPWRGINRFYAGLGFTPMAPVFNVADVSGSTAESDSVSFKDRYFTEKGPYFFIGVEPALGYQMEFGDCSLLRLEVFSLFRMEGLISKADPMHLERWIGLRAGYYFGTE